MKIQLNKDELTDVLIRSGLIEEGYVVDSISGRVTNGVSMAISKKNANTEGTKR